MEVRSCQETEEREKIEHDFTNELGLAVHFRKNISLNMSNITIWCCYKYMSDILRPIVQNAVDYWDYAILITGYYFWSQYIKHRFSIYLIPL